MEQHKQSSSPEEKLNAFRDEMRQWIADQIAKKQAWEERGRTGETYDPHAEHINPDYLTPDDQRIWSALRDQTLTRDQWDAYALKVREYAETASSEEKQSRAMFRAYLANEAQALLLQRELEGSNANPHT